MIEHIEYSDRAKLTIRGDHWGSANISVVIDGEAMSPRPTDGNHEGEITLPDTLLAGVHHVQIERLSGSAGDIRSNSVMFLLQPHLADDIKFSTVQLGRLRESLGQFELIQEKPINTVACTLTPEIDLNQTAELLLNQVSTDNGYTFKKVLQFTIEDRYEADLNARVISPDLQAAFHQNLFPLSLNATVTGGNRRWLIQEPEIDQTYALRKSQGQLLVNYGLAADDTDAINRTVFQVGAMEPGNYLVRIKLLGIPGAESRLRTNDQGNYVKPTVEVS